MSSSRGLPTGVGDTVSRDQISRAQLMLKCVIAKIHSGVNTYFGSARPLRPFLT